jgi:hypothetical protein
MVAEVERITETLRSYLKLEGSFSFSEPVYTGSNSTIYRGDGGALSFPVTIKQCLSAQNAERSAVEGCRLQYAALESVSKAMSQEAVLTAPKPVGMVEEGEILVIEQVDGRSLKNLMQVWRIGSRDVANAVERLGGWLWAFHDSQPLRHPRQSTRCG